VRWQSEVMKPLSVKALAEKTEDAYSYGRYKSWTACIKMLRARGYDDLNIEAILRSKWMRWADDTKLSSGKQATQHDLARFMDDKRNKINRAEVEKLTQETFAQ